MQSPSYNLEPVGQIFLRGSMNRKLIAAPFHPKYTYKDIMIKKGISGGSIIYGTRMVNLDETLDSYGLKDCSTVIVVGDMGR